MECYSVRKLGEDTVLVYSEMILETSIVSFSKACFSNWRTRDLVNRFISNLADILDSVLLSRATTQSIFELKI